MAQEPLRGADDVIILTSQKVCTASIRVINIGRETANKVELAFNWKPQHLNLWPVRHYESKCDQDSRHILIFDNLSPKEEIGIEIMSINADLPALIQVRSAECQAKNVPMMWIAYEAPWKKAITSAFRFLGLGALVYWLLVLIQFFIF